MAKIDPDIKQNYIELHETTGESYESIAGRAAEHGDAALAAWLRSRAAGDSDQPEEEIRAEPPKGRRPVKQEKAAAEQTASAAGEGDGDS